jgi:hypothetical protein
MLAESKRMAAAGRHYLGFELKWTRCEDGRVAVCVMMCILQRQSLLDVGFDLCPEGSFQTHISRESQQHNAPSLVFEIAKLTLPWNQTQSTKMFPWVHAAVMLLPGVRDGTGKSLVVRNEYQSSQICLGIQGVAFYSSNERVELSRSWSGFKRRQGFTTYIEIRVRI